MKFAISKTIDLENGKVTWSINPELLRTESVLCLYSSIGKGPRTTTGVAGRIPLCLPFQAFFHGLRPYYQTYM